MATRRPKPGDIFAIPGGDVVAIAKVIYASKFFRNVILLRVLKTPFLRSEGVDTSAFLRDADCVLLYTATRAAEPGEWQYIESQPVSDRERLMTERRVGTQVWIEDEMVRQATSEDYEKLCKMSVCGYIRVANEVAKLSR
jgi:hypothetical protein